MRCVTDIRQILFSRIDEIKEKFGVERLGIFFLDKNEDINILVEFLPGKLNFDNYMDLKFYLEELIGERGNLITKDGIKPM